MKNNDNSFMVNIKMTLYVVALAAIAYGVMYLTNRCSEADEPTAKEVVLEDTPITIEDIRPKGDLYVCSAIIEDYETLHKKESSLGLLTKEHTCAQIMRMKCSYMIDLEKVKYKQIEGKKVLVKLPKLEYKASLINSPFISDDESYWAKVLPSTNKLKKKVEKKIQKQFETQNNKDNGQRYAEAAIANLLKNLGYEAEFVSSLTKKRE